MCMARTPRVPDRTRNKMVSVPPSGSILLNILTVTVCFVAIFLGLLYYRKDELVLGQYWEYFPLWIDNTVVLSAHYLGIHSIINSSRIIFNNRGMKPHKDDEKLVRIQDTFLHNVPTRVYRPVFLEKNKKAPAIIFIHGGGFIYGGLQSHNGFCYKLARSAGAVVFLLEYRKAPEYIFPTAFNDCYEASIHLVNNAENYTIDPSKIVLMGDSAGGNLAAAVAQYLASLKQTCVQFAFAAQVLIYPTLQFFDFTLPSFQKEASEVIIRKESIARFWSLYINGTDNLVELFLRGNHTRNLRTTRYQGYLQTVDHEVEPASVDPAGTVPECVLKALTDPRACPLLADDLRQNPRTLIVTADHDILRDDGILYGVRLKKDGVKVTHKSYSCQHGFLFFDFESRFSSTEALQGFYDIVSYLKDVFKDAP